MDRQAQSRFIVRVDRLEHDPQILEIVIGGVVRQPFSVDALQPPIPQIEHVHACQIDEPLIAGNANEVVNGPAA